MADNEIGYTSEHITVQKKYKIRTGKQFKLNRFLLFFLLNVFEGAVSPSGKTTVLEKFKSQ